MGIVRGPYSEGEWLTMLAYKASVSRLHQKNKEHHGRYQDTINKETGVLKKFFLRGEEPTTELQAA